ncbi:EamA family transporter [Massilia suwonensis]|uniref:EamA family transporter n=1 Tax=Massilia suwonensis TaxID=648895 RepID=A0ABW0MT89_9BURK
MNGFVIAAVLCAALMHALWNVLLKRHAASGVPTMAIVAGSGLLCAAGLPFVAAPAPASWPFIAASALAQTVYYRLLAATYRDGDLSHAYPLMRGCAPPLVALAGLVMGEHLRPGQWLALGLVCGGVLAIFLDARRQARADRLTTSRTTLLALATACVIALYTLIDGVGVRRSGAAAGYTMWLFALTALALVAQGTAQERRALLDAALRRPGLLLGGGALSAASYGIALWAMTLAPVALVAALRETSILFAAAIAALVLRERIGRARLLAVVLIACGAAAMRLS